MSGSYRDLVAWQKGMALAVDVYRLSEEFPRREMYGLTQQVRRAAVSVPSNIAEGKGRQTKKDYLQYLYRSRGSLYETQTQLEVARDLKMCAEESFAAIAERAAETGKVLNGLIKAVQQQLERKS